MRSSTRPPDASAVERLGRAAHTLRRALAAAVVAVRFALTLVPVYVRTRRVDAASLGVAMRRYLERMGFAYVKMGQFLALRFDVLPREVCQELGKLFDRATPIPFPEVRRLIEAELGGPLGDFFLSVEPEAVAAASLAQVHVATAIDGERVALKVQRPRARRDYEADMRLAGRITRFVDWTRVFGSISLSEVLDEFDRFTRRELDFRVEGQVAAQIARRTSRGVRVPRIRDDLTTSGLLTMEFVEGRSLREAIELTKRGRRDELDVLFPGVDMKAVIRTVARESLGQTLIHGLFQADPHPGNILIAPDGAVVYLDFGMFGVLSPLQRLNCLGYIENAAMGEAERSFEYFFKLIITTPDLNRIEFKRDMVVLMRTWAEWSADDGGRFSDRHLGTIMMKTLSTMRVNGTRLDTDMLLFWRVLFVLDSVALDLAEHVDLIEVMQEFFIEHASPVRRRFDLLAESAVPDLILHRRSIGRTGTCLRAPDGGTGRRPVATLKPRPSRRVGRERSFLVVASLVLTAAAVLLRG